MSRHKALALSNLASGGSSKQKSKLQHTHRTRLHHNLVELLRRTHRGLDGQRTDVLPVLLEQRHQKVDGGVEVENKLILGHINVSNGDAEGQDLLHLELDGGLDVIDLVDKLLVVGEKAICVVSIHTTTRGDSRGELARLVETGAKQTGDLLDQGGRGNESVVLLGKLLHELLVLVELLEGINIHARHAFHSGLINVRLVTKDADAHARTGDSREPEMGQQLRNTSMATYLTVPLKRLSFWGS